MFTHDFLRKKDSKSPMSRSNTSLELVYSEYLPPTTLRREYGSHGSIDVISGDGVSENTFFTMVQDYNDQNLVGNQSLNAETPFSRPRVQAKSEIPCDDYLSMENVTTTVVKTQTVGTSPKLRLKFHKFWSNNGQSNFGKSVLDDCSLTMNSVHENFSSININGDPDEQHKRRHFAHYDCQSLVANLGYAAKLRSMLLSRRRNTTTGASAASLLQSRVSASTDILSGVDSSSDAGDGRYNDLVESCPFFRNEIGGEEERCVSLCWRTSRTRRSNKHYYTSNCWHRPAGAYGLSILEFPTGQSHWKQPCPYYLKTSNGVLPIESQDQGALYYRKYFYGQDHQNWFGMDDQLGPVAISIKKERVELTVNMGGASKASPVIPNSNLVWQYRLIIRTSELFTLRGSVLEDAITTVKPSNNSKNYSTKDVLEYVAPEIQLSCLRLGSIQGACEEQLLRLDEQCVTRHYKVGIMYCKKDQATEEEMYNNQEAGPAFIEFLQSLGQTVRLKGFDKYKAGLDNKTDSTGLYSVYTTYQDCEVMFHVSTMLPYTPNNRQQLLRKRHIGNDIVTVVFQEPGAQPFTPKNIRSQFQHVFIIVRAINPCTENTHYSIAVSRSKEVPLFGPPIREDAVYAKGEAFTDLLLSKVINGENAAIQSPKFSTMATRTRQEYLKDLAKNYTTATALDTGQKFSLFSSLLMKGTHQQANNATGHFPPTRSTDGSLGPDILAAGALCWPVSVQDEGAGGTPVDCFLGISTDTIVVIEETSRQIVFVMPTRALLGWVVCGGGWVRVYHHRGECVCIRARSGDAPLLRRLRAVAPPGVGCAEECVLERNGSGQLGFHVQPDGLVTAVEPGGPAARSGLRRGARLLEVCRAAVATLAHDQLVDLLKTSAPVTVTLAPPAAPACCCDAGGPEAGVVGEMGVRGAALPGRQRRKCERSFSPPRSSDSSGYGTGGSARSARRSPEAAAADAADPAARRHSSDSPLASPRRATPARRGARPASGAGSLQEELLRLIAPEEGVLTTARPALVASPAPLPLPEEGALDWPALVDTATRAMLQICEEHQYPSMDNNSTESTLSQELLVPEPIQEPWRDIQAIDENIDCVCGLRNRVTALEAAASQSAESRRDLEEEVRRLRRHNARLREESARAVRQLRRFTEWFMQTVERQ